MGTLGMMKDMLGGFINLQFGRELTGKQRTMVTLMGRAPDRIPLACGVTNVNPFWVDKNKYDYNKLTHEPKLAAEYVGSVRERVPEVDWWAEPWVGGVMLAEGAAECGTAFEFPKDTFPYPVRYKLNSSEDLEALKLEKGGYLGNYLETFSLLDDLYPDLMFTPLVPCPWTLGTFIRGADRLIQDFLIYKGFIETESAANRRKLERRAEARAINPLFWEREMDVFQQLCFEIQDRHNEAGTLRMGTIGYDLYASPPNLDVESYIQYVLPYAKEIMQPLRMAPLTWQPTTPDEFRQMKEHYDGFLIGNLGYEIDERGYFSRRFDEDTIAVATEFKTFATMMISPDFLRDASSNEVFNYTSQLCSLVVEKKVPTMCALVGVAANTPHENVRAVIEAVENDGYYN